MATTVVLRRPAMWRCIEVLLAGLILLAAHVGPALAEGGKAPPTVKTLGKAVKPEALAQQRGGQQVLNLMDVNAKVYDNRAIDTISGNNYISDSAFSHASGVPIAIQNSGNNVVIQNSMILNLQMK